MDVWALVSDPENREVLSWIGGGIVVLAGGVWAAIKFFVGKRSGGEKPPPTVSASGGGIAVGRDVKDSQLSAGGRQGRK